MKNPPFCENSIDLTLLENRRVRQENIQERLALSNGVETGLDVPAPEKNRKLHTPKN